MSAPPAPAAWHALPTEMKFSVVAQLDAPADLRAFSQVSKDAYAVAVPALWRVVDLPHLEALQAYLAHVPPAYHRYIRQLTLSTAPKAAAAALAPPPPPTPALAAAASAAVAALLAACTQLERLTLNLAAGLAPAVVPCFERLERLTALAVNHVGDQQTAPLSERLVVSIAASVPHLRDLALDRIARSALHAPELVGAYPFVPVACGDAALPPHARLGTDLALPALLRLPTLRTLRIRDTHLGDPQWRAAPPGCALELLDLGSCALETPEFNRRCTERIVGAVGHAVGELALHTPLSPVSAPAQPGGAGAPLKRLRRLHITPLFPVEAVADTLAALAGSPVEALSVRCYADDVADMCAALTGFLAAHDAPGAQGHAQGQPFCGRLAHIDVAAVAEVYDAPGARCVGARAGEGAEEGGGEVALSAEQAQAVRALQAFCADLRRAADAPVTTPAPAPASMGAAAACVGADGDEIECVPAKAAAPANVLGKAAPASVLDKAVPAKDSAAPNACPTEETGAGKLGGAGL